MPQFIDSTNNSAGSARTNDPRHIKEILDELLESGQLFNNIFPNTELDVDIKLLTLKPGRLDLGEGITGIIVRDNEFHYTFVQIASETDVKESPDATKPTPPDASEKKGARVKRNPIVIPGNCVNLHRKGNGSFYPTFRYPELTEHYTWNSFCIEAAKEILSLTGLIEEKRNPDN